MMMTMPAALFQAHGCRTTVMMVFVVGLVLRWPSPTFTDAFFVRPIPSSHGGERRQRSGNNDDVKHTQYSSSRGVVFLQMVHPTVVVATNDGRMVTTTNPTTTTTTVNKKKSPSILPDEWSSLTSTSFSTSSQYIRGWLETTTTSSSSSWWMTQLLVADATTAVSSTSTPPSPPTKQEIDLLRRAFGAFYGNNPNPNDALPLLDQAIQAWERQPVDEKAGLYRVRGDCYMALSQPEMAIKDYSTAITLLLGPGGDLADPIELPASFLGRARAVRSLGVSAASSSSSSRTHQAVIDYQEAFQRYARNDDWDTPKEAILDGARTNPYAMWEYGMALRLDTQYNSAQEIHTIAAQYFDDIGDRPRSVISQLDAAIDAAAAAAAQDGNGKKGSVLDDAKILLQQAIQRTTTVESRDVPLLQRVLAKEGEGRMALAALEWSTVGDRQQAETELSTTCQRLDQLEADALQRGSKTKAPPSAIKKLTFNIDDLPGALETSCTRLKNKTFLRERLEWPIPLLVKADKLIQLAS